MIKVENVEVFNFEGAIRGMRHPLNSCDKRDSYWGLWEDPSPINPCDEPFYFVGKNDLTLMKKLYKAGSEHRKYLRQIFVSMDITAPLYWWKEADTYKIGTVANSCSTMHTIHKRDLTENDFSCEHLFLWDKEGEIHRDFVDSFDCLLDDINVCRKQFIETGDKKFWYVMIQMLPSSYNQKRTVTMNYENVVNIIKQRSGHKLDEWNEFIKVLKELPYIKEIMG